MIPNTRKKLLFWTALRCKWLGFRMTKNPQTNLINLKSTCFIKALQVSVTLPQTHTETECMVRLQHSTLLQSKHFKQSFKNLANICSTGVVWASSKLNQSVLCQQLSTSKISERPLCFQRVTVGVEKSQSWRYLQSTWDNLHFGLCQRAGAAHL